MPVLLSRTDAREAARACRAVAYQQRQQAATLSPPTSEILVRGAERLERLAGLFEAHAESARRA